VKFYSNQLANIVTAFSKGGINAALFYGPDHGLVEYSISELAKKLHLEKRSISYSDSSSSEIISALNNINLFGTRELIRVNDLPSSIDASFKDMCKSNYHHILVIAADELTPSSSLRKLFEQEPNLAAVACYNDNEESVEKIIRSYIVKENKNISPDAMRFLKHSLHGDRFIIINELEKLFCYAINKPQITLDDVCMVISSSISSEPDKLCMYFLSHNLEGYCRELEKLLSNNTPAVWIIRAISRYYINAYIVLSKIEEGVSIDDAIASLTPPIFFKYISIFKQTVSKISLQQTIKLLNILYEAEKSLKSGVFSPKQICTQIFFAASNN